MRMVYLSVTYNVVGLDVEEPVKIFQRYYTTKSVRGHGIGLHWSANVVTSMGGHLFARSGGKGRGTSLHLRVPVAPSRRKNGVIERTESATQSSIGNGPIFNEPYGSLYEGAVIERFAFYVRGIPKGP